MNYKALRSDYYKRMGAIIKGLRIANNISLKELSQRSCYTERALEDMETGKLFVNDTKLKAIAEAFDMSPFTLRRLAEKSTEVAS